MCMAEQITKAVTIKQVPVVLWKRVRMKALSMGEDVSEFAVRAFEAALKDAKKS
jgi:hypothetical protein